MSEEKPAEASVRPNIVLAPRRRTEDGMNPGGRSWLVSFTDLLALLLSFFVMLYATRDPSPKLERYFVVPPIAPIVPGTAPNDASENPALSRIAVGLDLNYIAALLRQTAGRDEAMAGLMIAPHDYSLTITLARADQLAPLLDKLAVYRRTMAVFGAEAALTPLYGHKTDADIRFFPQDARPVPMILIY